MWKSTKLNLRRNTFVCDLQISDLVQSDCLIRFFGKENEPHTIGQ